MYINSTYQSIQDQYRANSRSNRTHLKIDSKQMRISSTQLDQIADAKLYAGYDNKRNRTVCKICFVRKSVNGSCNC